VLKLNDLIRNRRAEISRVHGELNRGYATGGAVRHIKKGIRTLGEAAKKHVARKEAAKVQAGKDEIRKSDMGYAKGGKS
jgi:SLT domain-containing protein